MNTLEQKAEEILKKCIKEDKDRYFSSTTYEYDGAGGSMSYVRQDIVIKALQQSESELYQLREENEDLKEFLKQSRESVTEADRMIAQLREDYRLVRELLPIVHGDGGHYTEKHGLTKSVEDAIKIVMKLRQEKEELLNRSWISIRQQAPEYMQACIIHTTDGFVTMAQFGGGSPHKEVFVSDQQWYIADYWQPLPKPPVSTPKAH